MLLGMPSSASLGGKLYCYPDTATLTPCLCCRLNDCTTSVLSLPYANEYALLHIIVTVLAGLMSPPKPEQPHPICRGEAQGSSTHLHVSQPAELRCCWPAATTSPSQRAAPSTTGWSRTYSPTTAPQPPGWWPSGTPLGTPPTPPTTRWEASHLWLLMCCTASSDFFVVAQTSVPCKTLLFSAKHSRATTTCPDGVEAFRHILGPPRSCLAVWLEHSVLGLYLSLQGWWLTVYCLCKR